MRAEHEIQEALENNPLLEEAEDENARREEHEERQAEAATDKSGGGEDEAGEPIESASGDDQTIDRDGGIDDESFRDEMTGDAEWEEGYETLTAPKTRNDSDDPPDLDARNSAPTSLREHLLWQMHMTLFSPVDLRIAEAIIDAIDDDGYLKCSLEEIQQALSTGITVETDERPALRSSRSLTVCWKSVKTAWSTLASSRPFTSAWKVVKAP